MAKSLHEAGAVSFRHSERQHIMVIDRPGSIDHHLFDFTEGDWAEVLQMHPRLP